MRKFFIFTVAFLIGGMAAAAQTTIDIDIEGLGNNFVAIDFQTSPDLSSQGNPLNVIAGANDGKLVWHPKIEGLNIVTLHLKQLDFVVNTESGGTVTFRAKAGAISFPLLPGDNIKVRGRVVDKHLEAEVTGTEAAVVGSLLQREMLPDEIVLDSLTRALVGPDGMGEEEFEQLQRKYNEYRTAKYKDKPIAPAKWLLENPDSPAADFVLAHLVSVDYILKQNPALVERARKGVYGPIIEAKLRRSKAPGEPLGKLAEGDAAPEFTLQAPDGGTFSLIDVKKDYVVIDFWASWCGPCISGFPKMKEYYEKYGDRLEIVGIATMDNRSAWLGMLKRHNLPWVNVLDIDDVVGERYGAESLPTKIILGPERNIVSKFIGEGEDFYNKLDELLK